MASGAPMVFGKYQLLSQIARGGMAEVWKAKAHGVEGFEKILVIKRILPELSENPRFVEMFINEAKIAVTLSHANVVHVFDLGQVDGSYYIAMEHVAGVDLSAMLKRLGRKEARLSPSVAVYIVSELAKGLDYAHRRRDAEGNPLNIVHRDVSPQNILLSVEGEVKLTDFGIAKARTVAQQVTELGVVKGKYAYMAPEQLLGGKLDARADVFAAGILLYECLSGQNPFHADTTYETLQRVREGRVTPLSDLVPCLSHELGESVCRAMAFRPEDRYPTAGDLYEDLVQYLYSSGERVGGRELADYVRELRAVGDEAAAATDLARVFEVDHVTAIESEEKPRRPVASPASAFARTRVARRRKESASPVPTPQRERTERRDVTALCIRRSQDDPLALATARSLVERFGGSVVDGEQEATGAATLFALFGDRVPDGRDSEHAARCALRVSRAACVAAAAGGRNTTVAIGIHAGRVLVDLEGGLIRDGHVTAVLAGARRQAQSAEATQVVVDPATERELHSRFRLVPNGPAPSLGHLLTSERSLADAYGRFIGRREVLKAVGECLAKANRGSLQTIGLSGEAGAGKSRLLIEILRRLNLAGHTAALHVAALTPQMRYVPLSAIQEMLRVVLGVDEFDPENLLRDRITRLRELGLSPAEQNAVAAALGLPTKQQRGGLRPLRAALLRVVRKLAEDRLTIFAWDAAEHMDDDSSGIINDMLQATAEARVAAILCYRPGFEPAWRTLENFREVALGRLSDEEVARLTATRLGADEIPFDLLREVTNKSRGNPLYVEEYIKALSSAGAVVFDDGPVIYRPDVAQVGIPKTLRGIIASRVARLPGATRYLLQVAAQAGERFNLEVVAAAAEEEVDVVTTAFDADALQGLVGGRGHQDRVFSHDLVRQVVLEGITLSAQKEIHLALAEAIMSLRPDLEDELAGRLARHFEAAGQHGRAVEFLGKAASRLEREGAFEAAIGALEHAIGIMTAVGVPDTEAVFKLYERISDLAYRGRALMRGVDLLGNAIKRAEVERAPRWLASFYMWRGRLLAAASRVEEGGRWLDQAQHVARGLTDADLSREVFVATADVDARRGQFERAVGYLQEALQLARHDHNELACLRCLIPLALTYARMGDPQSAMTTLSEVHALAKRLAAEPSILCEIHRLESQIHYHARNQRASAEAATRATQVAREANLAYEEALNAHHLGEAYLRLGDHRRAFAALRSSYDIATERGYARLQMSNLRALGFIDATRFGSAEGRARVAQAIAYAEKHEYVWDVIQGKYLMAIIEQVRGAHDTAKTLLQDVLDLAVRHNHRNYTEDAEDALRCLEEGQPITVPE